MLLAILAFVVAGFALLRYVVGIPLLANLVNRVLPAIWPFNHLSLNQFVVARPAPLRRPARTRAAARRPGAARRGAARSRARRGGARARAARSAGLARAPARSMAAPRRLMVGLCPEDRGCARWGAVGG